MLILTPSRANLSMNFTNSVSCLLTDPADAVNRSSIHARNKLPSFSNGSKIPKSFRFSSLFITFDHQSGIRENPVKGENILTVLSVQYILLIFVFNVFFRQFYGKISITLSLDVLTSLLFLQSLLKGQIHM